MKLDLENPLILIPLMVGGIFCICGCILYLFPPKNINFLYGYRTKTSMQNQEIWDFAQKYSGKVMAIYGFIFTLLTFPFSLLSTDSVMIGVGIPTVLIVVICLLLFYTVEKAIKNKFSKK